MANAAGPHRIHRQRPVHGVSIGIMMLDTGFQRLPGDIGYAPTWRFPVQFAVVRGATPDRIVRPNADGMLDLFLRAADELVAVGVDGITTSCGFLAILHPQLAAHCPVPVATSSLLQIPLVPEHPAEGQARRRADRRQGRAVARPFPCGRLSH